MDYRTFDWIRRVFMVVTTFESRSVTIQMKATEQNFPVALFIALYKVV